MAQAVRLAAHGLGATAPNPVVGCVLLDSAGDVVGRGWHQRAGGPHAEVLALREAGAAARGGTAVVTLEPCRHTGRTGPCVQALLQAGVARVVYAVADPTPAAAGGGQALAAAGVDVEQGLLETEAAEVNAAWLHSVRTGRPLVTWKLAATLDGRSAAADGSSRWITSPQARADVHLLRARSDAVVVGVGTVLADDPALTVRTLPGDGPAGAQDGVKQPRRPLRVVLDADGRTPADARVRDGQAPTLVLTRAEAGSGRGGRGVDLPSALAVLHERGVLSVLLEGGPTLAGAFVDEGLVDRVVAYLAPALLGRGTAALITSLTGASMAAVRRLQLTDVTRVGPDVRLTAVPFPAGPLEPTAGKP